MNSRPLPRRMVLGAAAATLLLAGCGGARAQSAGSGQTGSDAGRVGISKFPPEQRKPAPKLAGRTIDGGQLDVAQWHGKVVVVNVWGSWCTPCRAEAPGLRRVSEETRPLGVEFLGIDTRDDDTAGQAFEHTYGIRYPSLADPDGEILSRFTGVIPVAAVPSTVVIDRQGRVAARSVGATTYDTLLDMATTVARETPQ